MFAQEKHSGLNASSTLNPFVTAGVDIVKCMRLFYGESVKNERIRSHRHERVNTYNFQMHTHVENGGGDFNPFMTVRANSLVFD